MRNTNRLLGTLIALVVLVVCVMASSAGHSTFAQQETGMDVSTSIIQASYTALREIPVMVSVIKDGAIVRQKEVEFNSNTTFAVPPGLYDVRIEGDGMQTLVKRGIHVKEGERTSVVGGPMRVGTGVKVVEYSATGLSREEIAARLAKLEAALAELQKRPK